MIRVLARTAGELLLTAGALMLLFVAWQLWWTDVEANRAQAAITDRLVEQWGSDDLDPRPTPSANPAPEIEKDFGPPPEVAQPDDGEAFAIVRIPAFGPDWQERPVFEGTSLALLEDGMGHYEDAALPGQVGNFAVAGHRVTYGRPLNQIAELEPGDPIVVETEDAWFVYRMRSSTIVTPDRLDVVAPVPEQPGVEPTERLLTLTACHPMYSARERFIVYAVMDHWQPKTAGEPSVLAAG